MKKCFASFLAVVLLITALGTVAFGASSQITKTNPLDTGKEILYYLFWTVDDKLEKDLQDMQTSLGLSDEQMNLLKNLGLTEHQNNRSLKSTYSSNTRSSVASFNSRIESAAVDRNKTIESILGGKYAEFRSWIASWWEVERKYRMNPIETKADIELLQCGQRNMCQILNLGVPEAQAAYYDDYNNGKDEFGRIVLNPAGIDLSVEAAEDLGFGTYESGWVAVRYEYLP